MLIVYFKAIFTSFIQRVLYKIKEKKPEIENTLYFNFSFSW